jgi:hypothetical protein
MQSCLDDILRSDDDVKWKWKTAVPTLLDLPVSTDDDDQLLRTFPKRRRELPDGEVQLLREWFKSHAQSNSTADSISLLQAMMCRE